MSNRILNDLAHGDMRTIGKSEEVVREVSNNPALFHDVFQGLTHAQPGVRMRSADALEKVTAQQPELLYPYRQELLAIAAVAQQQEVQWHIAQMLAYIPLSDEEVGKAFTILESYVTQSQSSIVRVMALQTLANIATTHTVYRERVRQLVHNAIETGTSSVVARASKLLKILDK